MAALNSSMPPGPPTIEVLSTDPPLQAFVHFPGIGCIRLSDIAGWWWVEEAEARCLDIGLRDKRWLTISDPEKAQEAEALLLLALGITT